MGRIAGSDVGWGVLINSQLFIPVSLHRGEQESKSGREGGREEMQRGEGGREATATAASMHRCSLLNVSISPSLLPLLPPSAFDLPSLCRCSGKTPPADGVCLTGKLTAAPDPSY